jgi:hypothetical protein
MEFITDRNQDLAALADRLESYANDAVANQHHFVPISVETLREIVRELRLLGSIC